MHPIAHYLLQGCNTRCNDGGVHLGQLAAPDVVDLGQLLDVALPPLALPVDEEPILVHPDTVKIITDMLNTDLDELLYSFKRSIGFHNHGKGPF